MKCKCGSPMIISTWDGWRWMCFNCDNIGRIATKKEVEKLEEEQIDKSEQPANN